MLENSKAFSGIGVDDLDAAKHFYGETLEQKLEELDPGAETLIMHLSGDRPTLIYRSQTMSPAGYTVLNFPVDDVAAAVDALVERGVEFERYDGMDQDERGINQGGGPEIAWFKDPAGNILSVLKEE